MGKTLLLVDDDVQILETAQDILEAEGFIVHTAGTGEQAMERLRASPCRVMLTDFNLPDTTGVELALQAKALSPSIAVILMTGEAHVDLGPGKSAILATLVKPVNPDELIALIHKNS